MRNVCCCASTDSIHHLLLGCFVAGAGAVPWGQLAGVLSTDDALHDVDDAADTADRQPQVTADAFTLPVLSPQLYCSQHTF
jgi:hypothetical protein